MRPALVRGSKRDNKSGRGALLVSYGTTQIDSNHTRGIDLTIGNAERLMNLDLPHAVRFDLGLTNWLPWASEFFEAPAHSLYIVAGPLNATEIKRLRACLLRRGIITAL